MLITKNVLCIFPALSIALVVFISCDKPETRTQMVAPPASALSFKGAPSSNITFLSTQLNPVEEAGKMRGAILKDFPGKVDFRPNDSSYMFTQVDALLRDNPSEAILVGAGHGDLVSLYEEGALRPLDSVWGALGDRKFNDSFMKLCRLDGKTVYYIPWMQASFVMVASKKALPYLPKGASLDELTYEELYRWAKDISDKTGKKALGFPAGKNGLMHRFFQGFLYPSYTASTLLKFRSPDAKGMWSYFNRLWGVVHPGSLVYSTMAEPLLTGDVWIAWDHSARLVKAFKEKPDDFVAFPSPVGPLGRGYMLVVSGLGIPKAVKETKSQAMLIDYLTRPAIQNRTLSETGFFPVVASSSSEGIPNYLKGLNAAVDKQASSGHPVPTLMPIGIGERGNDYNNLFLLTFSEIVLEGKDMASVLNENAAELQAIIDGANAKCWLPDVSDARPCKIE
jgi:multiple sugar transport system substrate-binding protein